MQLTQRFLPPIIALLLGALMPLAFAPFHAWYVAPIALAILLYSVEHRSAQASAWLGFLFGLSMFTVGLWWVRISVHQFGGAPLPLAIAMVMLLAAYLALYYGALLYGVRKLNLPPAMRYLLWLPTLGTLLEVLRAHLFTGFPWLALGYSLTDSPFALWLFPTFGALISSFVVYFMAGLLLYIVMHLRALKNLVPIALGIVAIAVITAGFAHMSDPIEDQPETLNIALVQGNITQDQKFDEAHFYQSIQTYVDLTSTVIEHANLVIWPETAVVAYYDQVADLMANLRHWSDLTDTEILIGIPRENENLEQFNAFVHLGQTAKADQFYDKHRLLPFGEYIPAPAIFGTIYDWINMPLVGFTKGQAQQAPFTFPQFSTQTTGSICFEAVFGESLRYQAKQSGFLVNISNDAWFGDSLAPWQHLQIVQARALEFARPIARATNTGVTAFVDHHGNIIAKAPLFTATTLTHAITGKQGLTTYVKLGDALGIGLMCALLLLLMLFVIFKRRVRT